MLMVLITLIVLAVMLSAKIVGLAACFTSVSAIGWLRQLTIHRLTVALRNMLVSVGAYIIACSAILGAVTAVVCLFMGLLLAL